jgi:hypothetical protein
VSIIRWTAAAMGAWILNRPVLKEGGTTDVGTNEGTKKSEPIDPNALYCEIPRWIGQDGC